MLRVEVGKLEDVLGTIYIGIWVRVGLRRRHFNVTHRSRIAHTEMAGDHSFVVEISFGLHGSTVVRRPGQWKGWQVQRLVGKVGIRSRESVEGCMLGVGGVNGRSVRSRILRVRQ